MKELDAVYEALHNCRYIAGELAYWNDQREGHKMSTVYIEHLNDEIEKLGNAFSAYVYHEFQSSMNFNGGLMVTVLKGALKLAGAQGGEE